MKKYLFDIASASALAAAFVLFSAPAGAQGILGPNRGVRRTAATPGGAAANGAANGTSAGVATASAAAAGDEGDSASDLNFKEAPLDMVLEVYGKLVGRTVLKDPQTPNATITLQSRPGQKLTKEDQVEALEVVLEMNGVHFENYGEKFVRALPRKDARKEGIPLYLDAEAATLDGVPDGKVISVNISFKNITTEEAQKALEGFKSNNGLLQVFERTNSILVTDTRQNIAKMSQIAKLIDIATPVNEIVRVVQIKHAAAEDVQAALQKIVEDAMKYQEKDGKAQQNAQNANRSPIATPTPTLLRRPGANGPQSAAPTSLESLVTSVSDADRGMIRGRVLIVPDQRSNKLIIVTNKSNMDFFEKVIEALDVETTPDVQVKVYRLKYADAEDAADMINDLIGNSSSSKTSSRQNQNQNARNGQGGNLTRGTTPGATTRTTSANQRTGEAKAGELSKENTTVLADKRINGLVVMTQKELVPVVEQIIESMDVKLSQVLIETMIIEVTLGDELESGIDWISRGRASSTSPLTDSAGNKLYYAKDSAGNINYNLTLREGEKATASDGSTLEASSILATAVSTARDGFVSALGNSSTYSMGGGALGGTTAISAMSNMITNFVNSGFNLVFKSDKLNLGAILHAVQSDNRGKYIASPIIMTVDNKEATVDATDMRYLFKGYQYSGSTYNGSAVPDYEQKEIGIKIKVKPKINPNGTVMLNIATEYSKVNVGDQTVDGVKQDTTTTRTMTADALLDNMQTVVLGGLTKTEVAHVESGIPILKDIPWIGKWLFSSVRDQEYRKELLVFMTPYVLDDAESAQAEAFRRKRSLSDPSPWEDHGWSDSELADPVSKKEQMRRLKAEAKKQDEERQTRLAIEKWKMERAKALEKMSESERKFWIEQHRDELEKEEKKKFDEQMKEQADLKILAEQIKEERMRKAEAMLKENEDALRAENEHARLEAEKAKYNTESAPSEPVEQPEPAPAEPAGTLDDVEPKPVEDGQNPAEGEPQ